jgi:hypothetical protein
VCDTTLGCLVRPVTAACSDGNACTQGDHCTGLDDTCVGSPVDCDDHEPCTVDACDAGQGCTHDAFPDGTTCPATDVCRGPATCRDGVCDPGPGLSCDDADACTVDSCDSLLGCVYATLPGLPGVACHVTQLRAVLATLPPNLAALVARLGARLDCVEHRLTAAGAGPRRHALRRARRCLVRFIARVKTARQLDGSARDVLRAEAERTLAALDAVLAG